MSDNRAVSHMYRLSQVLVYSQYSGNQPAGSKSTILVQFTLSNISRILAL